MRGGVTRRSCSRTSRQTVRQWSWNRYVRSTTSISVSCSAWPIGSLQPSQGRPLPLPTQIRGGSSWGSSPLAKRSRTASPLGESGIRGHNNGPATRACQSGGLIALEVTGRTVSLDHRPRHSQKSFRIANGSGSVREFGWCTRRDSNPCVSYDTYSPIVYGHSTIRRPKTDATKTRRHKFL